MGEFEGVVTCLRCWGSGAVATDPGPNQTVEDCEICDGKGEVTLTMDFGKWKMLMLEAKRLETQEIDDRR